MFLNIIFFILFMLIFVRCRCFFIWTFDFGFFLIVSFVSLSFFRVSHFFFLFFFVRMSDLMFFFSHILCFSGSGFLARFFIPILDLLCHIFSSTTFSFFCFFFVFSCPALPC